MYRNSKWLLALSLAALLAPASLFAQDSTAELSGKAEIGVAGIAAKDDISRVNEYSTGRTDDGVTGYGKLDLDIHDSRGIVLEGEAEIQNLQSDTRDANYDVSLDANRFIRAEINYDTFEHQLDHDRMNYLDAAVIRGSKAPIDWQTDPQQLSGDFLPPFLLIDGATETVKASNGTNDFSFVTVDADDRVQQTGGAMLKGEDLTPDAEFKIQHREFKGRVEVPVPQLPGVTLDVGYRHEEREGLDQSIGMSKCSGCHITGESREVDEVTQDVSAGATGRFGLLTVRYEFTDRQFNDRENDPSRLYDPAVKPGANFNTRPFDNRLTYDYKDNELDYGVTPDSEKETHLAKARVDLPSHTDISAAYVNTQIESAKTDEPGIFTLSKDTLTTDYDIYGVKAGTRIGKRLKLSAHARFEELENDDVSITFDPIKADNTTGSAGIGAFDEPIVKDRESVISRDVTTAGIDAVYRLARRSTLRLGYEFKEVDREDEEFGKTETNTAKASLKVRPAKTLSTRLSYTYQDIDDPFHHEGAAGVPLTTNTSGTTVGSGPAYGTTFYSAREKNLSNLPETVHEGKFATTWAPSARFSATVNYRYKDEENELNQSIWEQQTHAPGLSLWYAPGNRFNLTFAYNYFDQRTETAFCQGYYDG